MISFTSKGSFKHLDKFLADMSKEQMFAKMQTYAEEGRAALAAATPTDSGLTAASWTYEIVQSRGKHAIVYSNTHVHEGANIAILIQYGHGTGTGGYVQGRDYINPAIQPIFDRIANEVWKEVTSSG